MADYYGIGDVVRIELADGSYTLARRLAGPMFEFFNVFAVDPAGLAWNEELGEAYLRIWVMDGRRRKWKVADTAEVRLLDLGMNQWFFKQDSITRKLSKYRSNPITGKI